MLEGFELRRRDHAPGLATLDIEVDASVVAAVAPHSRAVPVDHGRGESGGRPRG